jgi:N,N'-diacetyllegionaminate synthase
MRNQKSVGARLDPPAAVSHEDPELPAVAVGPEADAVDIGALRIGGRAFSSRHALIVGEVAQAHDGSLGLAHAFIDAIANAGADAVKFQTHIAEAESTPSEPWRVAFSTQDRTRFDYWRRMEFAEEQWHELRDHATERGLLFLSSPFSVEAVALLERVGVPAWKIASGEMFNRALLRRVLETNLPVMVSTGLSQISEVDEVVGQLRRGGVQFAILQSTSLYPCPPEMIGLTLLGEMRDRYGCPVGLSDHSGTIFAALAAASLGASVIEIHVTLSGEMFGPDVSASVTTGELRQLVEGVRYIERMRAGTVDKDEITRELWDTRRMFTQSLVTLHDLPAGTVVRAEDLGAKKPGTGVPPERASEIVGRRVRRDVRKNELLSEDDLEPGVFAATEHAE